MADLYGIACNHMGDSVVAPGALCWLTCIYGGGEQATVRVRSRGGRWVRRDLAVWKLSNFRAKHLPPVDVKFRDERSWTDRAEAEQEARRLDGIAQAERARRNMREIERMAGLMDEHGKRNDGRLPGNGEAA